MKKENKKKLYLGLWIITGLLLGLLAGGLVEYEYLTLNASYSLSTLYGITIVVGGIFGVWAGPVAWKKIYVDGARGKKYIAK